MTSPAPTVDELIDRLERALNELPFVAAVILFGSQATGRAHAESDIDVAVLLRPEHTKEPRYPIIRKIYLSLATEGIAERADVVILNDAGPALAFRVLRDGRVAVCNDEAQLHLLRVRTASALADYERVEAFFLRVTRERALRGSHG